MLTSFSGCTDFNWAMWCLSFNPEIHKKKDQLIDRQSKITGELSLPARLPPGVSYAPCQQHAPYVTLDPLNLTLPMNLKVEVTIRSDLTRPWHCQQGSIDKGRQGTGFVPLFRCGKVTQTRNPTAATSMQRQRWEFSEVQRGGTAVCAQLTMQKQGTENGPPGESQHCQLCQTQNEERKEQNYTVLWENGEKKNEAESRLIGLFGKPNSPRRAANKHGKQWENNEKWVKWNAKHRLRCWFSKGQWNNVIQLVV